MPKWLGAHTPLLGAYGLWLLFAMYLGYSLWIFILPSPIVKYRPPSPLTRPIDQLLQDTGWYSSETSVAAIKPSSTVTHSISLQGVLMRENGTSLAILMQGGTTELAIQDIPTKSGYTLRVVRPFEVEVEEADGRRLLVQMTPQKTINALYQKNPISTTTQDVFIPNNDLALRPINPNIPRSENIYLPQYTQPSIPEYQTMVTPNPGFNSLSLPTAENLPIEALRLLNRNTRFRALALDKQEQIRHLMATPQFYDAVRDDPAIIDQLIDSYPSNVN